MKERKRGRKPDQLIGIRKKKFLDRNQWIDYLVTHSIQSRSEFDTLDNLIHWPIKEQSKNNTGEIFGTN